MFNQQSNQSNDSVNLNPSNHSILGNADCNFLYGTRVNDYINGGMEGDRLSASHLLLASTAEDGWVALWHRGTRLLQTLTGAPHGFSSLTWHPHGHQLAAGGLHGELLIRSQTQ